MEPRKKIKILTPGLITVLGGIYGPILTPYMEKESVIFKLVAAGVKVVEVLDTGKEVAITVSNFKSDNDSASDKKVNKKTDKKAAPAVENVETTEPATEDAVVEPVVEDVEVQTADANEEHDDVVTEDPVSENVETTEPATEDAVVEPVVEDVTEPVSDTTVETHHNYNKHNKNNKRR